MRQVSRSKGGPSVRDPRTLAIPPVRLRDPGGGGRSAAVALVALVSVVAVAVAIPALLADQPGPSPPAVGRASVAPVTRSPGESASGASAALESPPEPIPAASLRLPDEVYNAHELVQAVEAGGPRREAGHRPRQPGDDRAPLRPRTRSPARVRDARDRGRRPAGQRGRHHLAVARCPAARRLPGRRAVRRSARLHRPPASGQRTPPTIDRLTRALLRGDSAGAPAELFLVDGWLLPGPAVGLSGIARARRPHVLRAGSVPGR